MSILDTPSVDPNHPPFDPGTLLSPEGLATRWSVSRVFIYKCMERGLPTVKLGRTRRIRVGDADRWLAEQDGAR